VGGFRKLRAMAENDENMGATGTERFGQKRNRKIAD
jgi:hypothetical protein